MTLYKHIAVAIDFSKQSMEALERALNLKEQYGAQLTLVAVVDTVSFGSVEAYDVKYARQLAKDYEVQLQALKDEHAAKYGELHIRVEEGSPKKVLTSLENVDLIVCGATGKSKTEQIVLGSISTAIVRYAKSDVFIVRNEQ